MGINFSADTLEDSLETLQDLLEQTGILLVQILVATPEDEQNQQLQYWANLLDVSSDVTGTVQKLYYSWVRVLSQTATAMDNHPHAEGGIFDSKDFNYLAHSMTLFWVEHLITETLKNNNILSEK